MRFWKSAVIIALALAGAKFLVQLAAIAGYGIFRDELYYVACARHPAWGYVEFPPLAPMLLRISTAVLGDGVFGIRLPMAIAGAALVALTCLLTREIGGCWYAQFLAGPRRHRRAGLAAGAPHLQPQRFRAAVVDGLRMAVRPLCQNR